MALTVTGGESYIECEVCTEKSPIIWGEGNPLAPIAIILDNPGTRINKEGNEYVCPTRQTLQKAIYDAGLKSEDIYVTYLLKCRPRRSYDKQKARLFSMPYLTKQIKVLNPKLLMFLGDTAVRSVLNDNDASVKELRGMWHNIMERPSIISYHPLAVIRRPNLKNNFTQDFALLAHRFYDTN
ncbi:MAG TPA: uracil-DNA glycosylase [Oscillospiraceae bacterium]|nr:uracil-DNA glycosylase [Oscillospiraceae bacterium]